MVPPFEGFGGDIIAFYEELHENNEKIFWEANKSRYERVAKAPMTALLTELETSFGTWKLFRPYRDIRFSKDKRPYKESIAASIGGRYISITRYGLYVGAGAHQLQGESLSRFRNAVASDAGDELARTLADLIDLGYVLAEPSLTKGPAGYPRDHPHIALLRHKRVTATRDFGKPSWLDEPTALDHVATAFGELEGLVSWMRRHVW